MNELYDRKFRGLGDDRPNVSGEDLMTLARAASTHEQIYWAGEA